MKYNKLRQLIKEEVKSLLTERFVNLWSKEEMKPYIKDVWDILQRSYKHLEGGFASATSPEHLMNKAGLMKLVRKDGKIVTAAIYKDFKGRKCIALGTDGSKLGVTWAMKIIEEDIIHNRSWSEVSDKVEKIKLKKGAIPIPNTMAAKILEKDIISLNPDGYHYTRLINGEPHEKIIVGNVSG